MRQNVPPVIDLSNGFGALKFGFATNEVENILGRPDDAEVVDPVTKLAAVWYYKPLNLRVGFFVHPIAAPGSEDRPLRVIHFLTGNPQARLWGKTIIGLGKSAVVQLFEEHGYLGFTGRVDELAASGYETLQLEKKHILLDFHNGVLKRILWGVVDVHEEGRITKGSGQ